MGKRHFEQMLQDARQADCEAATILIKLLAASPHELALFGQGYWANIPIDSLMVYARQLNTMKRHFYDVLKNLLVDGAIAAHVIDERGRRLKIHDPAVIDYDDPPAELEVLHSLFNMT